MDLEFSEIPGPLEPNKYKTSNDAWRHEIPEGWAENQAFPGKTEGRYGC